MYPLLFGSAISNGPSYTIHSAHTQQQRRASVWQCGSILNLLKMYLSNCFAIDSKHVHRHQSGGKASASNETETGRKKNRRLISVLSVTDCHTPWRICQMALAIDANKHKQSVSVCTKESWQIISINRKLCAFQPNAFATLLARN